MGSGASKRFHDLRAPICWGRYHDQGLEDAFDSVAAKIDGGVRPFTIQEEQGVVQSLLGDTVEPPSIARGR